MDQKGYYSYQFYGMPFEEEEEEEDGELVFLQFSVCQYSSVVTTFESIVRYTTIHRDGYVSKKAQNCSVREFRAVLFV